MNKVLNYFESYIGFIIYFGIQIIFGLLFGNVLNGSNYVLKSTVLIIMELVSLFILVLINKKRLANDFKNFEINYKEYLRIGFKAWIIGLIIMCISNLVINLLFTSGIAANESTDRFILSQYPLFSVIGMIVCGPFIEELAFRVGFKDHVNNKWLYYISSIMLFASMHVLNGITTPIELLYFIPYGALSWSFAYALNKTNNIFTTTIVHTFHNTSAVILVVLASIFVA